MPASLADFLIELMNIFCFSSSEAAKFILLSGVMGIDDESELDPDPLPPPPSPNPSSDLDPAIY